LRCALISVRFACGAAGTVPITSIISSTSLDIALGLTCSIPMPSASGRLDPPLSLLRTTPDSNTGWLALQTLKLQHWVQLPERGVSCGLVRVRDVRAHLSPLPCLPHRDVRVVSG
jgi:hypothetical protein